jgi:competence protein ComEC
MVLLALSLLGGELLSGWWPTMPMLGLVVAVVCGAWPACRRRAASAPLACLAAAGIGFWLASRVLEPSRTNCFVPDDGGPTKLWVEAELLDAPSLVDDTIRVPTTMWARGRAPERVCGTVLLTISEPPERLSVGVRIRVHASLRRPRNFANPRAYDYRGALARRGVWVTGHASGRDLEQMGPSGSEPVSLARERERIGALIDRSLPSPHASLMRSLVIGDQASVPAPVWDEIAAAGLAHLLSVSGLHIAAVWGLVFCSVRWALSRSEWLLLHSDVRAFAAAAALPPAGAYALLAGLSVPAARSVGMTALFVLSLFVGREPRPARVLCLVAGVVGIQSPGAPLEISFQLSFASVLALVVVGEAWMRWRAKHGASVARRALDRVALLFAVPAAALLGTAPLVALHFNRLTPVGMVTNPLLVPLCGTPATVIGLVGAALSWLSERAAGATFALAYWPLEILLLGAAAASSAPFATMRVPTPTLIELALLYALLAVPWIPRSFRRRAAAAALLLLAIDAGHWARERWWHRDVRVRFLDVGQGDAAVVELPGGTVAVIDGGGFARSRFDLGERVVAPYLWSRKILRVDYLVATHGDWDHQGGLHFLARELAPRELWIGAPGEERRRLASLIAEVDTAGGTVRTLHPGEVALDANGVRMECLHPPDGEALSANDSSLVLRLRVGSRTVLFTGDVESGGEALIAARFAPAAVDVLKVPHHGSATSSTDAFLRWVRPRVAVMSLGAGNSYGFPHPTIVDRYRRFGARTLRTDRDGSVAVSSDGRELVVRTMEEGSPSLCSGIGTVC